MAALSFEVVDKRCRAPGRAVRLQAFPTSESAMADLEHRPEGSHAPVSARSSRNVPVSYPPDPSSTSRQTTFKPCLQDFSRSPLTDSNRRPPPYHGGSQAVRAGTARHSRSCFPANLAFAACLPCPRVPTRARLMYPSRPRVSLSVCKTSNGERGTRAMTHPPMTTAYFRVGSAQSADTSGVSSLRACTSFPRDCTPSLR